MFALLQEIAFSCQVLRKDLAFQGKNITENIIVSNIVSSSFAFGVFAFSFKADNRVCQ
jgi:hypothetical protein